MALKYSFKLFFLNCFFEFMIKTAPQGSNSVNGREKYFKIIIKVRIAQWSHGPGSWGAGSNPGGATCIFFRFFFPFIVFLPFDLFPFILIADPL